MDATCTIQDSIHVFNLVHKYVSRILGTYQSKRVGAKMFKREEMLQPEAERKQAGGGKNDQTGRNAPTGN